jgi:hypothetical protein
MCACGCFVVAALVAAIVYGVLHGLWLMVAAAVLLAIVFGWFGKKITGPRNSS